MKKNKELLNKNKELDNYKDNTNSLDETKKNSQLIIEITNLKRINNDLNTKINEFKKKNNMQINGASSSQDFSTNINKLNEKIQNLSNNNKDLSEQINIISSEKEKIEILNNQKDEQIQKMEQLIKEKNEQMEKKQKIINDLNMKMNAMIPCNDVIKEEDSDSQSLNLSQNSISISNEIICNSSKDIKEENGKDYKKQYESLKKKYDKYRNETQIELSVYKREFKRNKNDKEEKSKIIKDDYSNITLRILKYYVIKTMSNYNGFY
jgi:hypothetical protein